MKINFLAISFALGFTGCEILPSHQTAEPCQGPDDYRGSVVDLAICYSASLQDMDSESLEREVSQRNTILGYTLRDADRLYLAIALLSAPGDNEAQASEVLNGIKIKNNRATAVSDFAKLLNYWVIDQNPAHDANSSNYRHLKQKLRIATKHEAQQTDTIAELNEQLLNQKVETEQLVQKIEALKHIDQTIDSRALGTP